MSFDTILVLIVIAFILISLYAEFMGPALTFISAVVVLGLFGVLSPSEILGGLGNEQIMVIIILLVIGDLIRKASVVEVVFNKMFKSTLSYREFMSRMVILVSGFSAFLNNTPLVAVMMPFANNWAKKKNVAPSKILIPLSYAAILGGCATLIGTSTNLIINGLYQEQQVFPDPDGLNMFDFAYVGIPMMFVGFLYLVFVSRHILPSRHTAVEAFNQNSRKYLVEAEVRKGSKLIGKTIGEAGLRNLKGLFLVEIRSKRHVIKAAGPDSEISENDVLVFAGETESIAELLDENQGLTLPMVGMLSKHKHTEIHEIIISHNSSLITKTVKEANFRARFDSAIIGIHRNGEKITGKIGDVKLRAGDVLILLGGPNLEKSASETTDIYFISKIREYTKVENYKIWILLGGTILAISLSAIKLISLFMGLITLLIILLAIKVTSPKDIPKSIDYNLAIIIAMALALGTAMTKTGVATMAAHWLMESTIAYGPLALLAGFYIITTALAAYITNAAAVALIFPIAISTAAQLGMSNPLPFVLVVSHAAAANFLTPIGYQTNLMVYGPGGYSFNDFFKVGFPLTLLYGLTTIGILYYLFF